MTQVDAGNEQSDINKLGVVVLSGAEGCCDLLGT